MSKVALIIGILAVVVNLIGSLYLYKISDEVFVSCFHHGGTMYAENRDRVPISGSSTQSWDGKTYWDQICSRSRLPGAEIIVIIPFKFDEGEEKPEEKTKLLLILIFVCSCIIGIVFGILCFYEATIQRDPVLTPLIYHL